MSHVSGKKQASNFDRSTTFLHDSIICHLKPPTSQKTKLLFAPNLSRTRHNSINPYLVSVLKKMSNLIWLVGATPIEKICSKKNGSCPPKVLGWKNVCQTTFCTYYCTRTQMAFSNQNKGHLGSRYLLVFLVFSVHLQGSKTGRSLHRDKTKNVNDAKRSSGTPPPGRPSSVEEAGGPVFQQRETNDSPTKWGMVWKIWVFPKIVVPPKSSIKQ